MQKKLILSNNENKNKNQIMNEMKKKVEQVWGNKHVYELSVSWVKGQDKH